MNWATELASLYVPGDGTAKVFGVVLYTRIHANIKRVLDDDDYWAAFDEISGRRWNVFAIRARQGHSYMPSGSLHSMHMMVPVWMEPNDNKELLSDFGLDSTQDLPCLVVFAPTGAGEVLATAIKLSDSSVHEAYGSIKEALDVVAGSLDKVLPEHLPGLGAYWAVEAAVFDHNQWRRLKAGVRVLEKLRDWIPGP